ncbi:pyrimidine reductase family protein [Haloechinothrix sp. YIM 98757]|uniref:Pyrimidine reductase family protein n=1 Tax=Haloechinothrix aidingensis TaxID=2752311 RepID=A0A838A7Q0_9PSEU|nr:pyrimidine reductase family protein [Haloechinothrix aidingensis]MBA0126060.1 pyrimidine reductase family protein [Haloechinothrix aidingensis]
MTPHEAATRTVGDADLEALYAYPEPLERPWVQANFIASVDGAASVEGGSSGLSHPVDRRVFGLGRDLADVVLAGAGTVLAENYAGVKPSARRLERRARLGLAEVPPIAVVSNSCAIPPTSRVMVETSVPPIVLTCQAAPPERADALRGAGAEVITAGEHGVDLVTALDALRDRGFYRIDCEGGPRLFAGMLAADLIDQLCLTVAPLATGAGADRIAAGTPAEHLHRFELASVLHEDGFLLLRYRRPAADHGT